MVCAGYFPTAIWHYFTMAFTLPNLFRRLFGEGALSAALIPVYTEQRQKDPAAAGKLAGSVLTLLALILAGLTLLGEGILFGIGAAGSANPKTTLIVHLAAIMLPYMILICLVAALGGLLQVHRHFAAPAAAPIVLNVFIIAAILGLRGWFGPDPWRQIRVVAWAVLAAGFAQLLLQVPALRRRGIHLRPRFVFNEPALKRIAYLMGPMLIGLSAMQLNTYLDFLIAYFLSATEQSGPYFTLLGRTIAYPVREGSVSHLYYAQRLYQLPLGIFGIALATAIFPELSRAAGRQAKETFARILAEGIRMVCFLALPATVGLILIRRPLVSLLFERGQFTDGDSRQVSATLLFYCLGITAYFLQHLIVRAYYSYQDSLTPVRIAVRVIGLNLVLNLTFIWIWGTGGLALSTALCAAVQTAILLRRLRRRFDLPPTQRWRGPLARIALATALMTAAGWSVLGLLRSQSPGVQVTVCLAACGLVYAGCCRLLGVEQLGLLLHRRQAK